MTIEPGADGFYHPTSDAEVAALVRAAAAAGTTLRVRGSGHSVDGAIYASGYDGQGKPPGQPYELMLDQMASVGEITPLADGSGWATVTVGGGCHLGKDPYDPTGTSTWENSLDYQLEQAGYALSDLGGISHQTVAGFLATGSSGGSLSYSIDTNIASFTFVDGTGAIHTVDSSDTGEKGDLFDAVGVSVGLLGIVTSLTFRVEPRFNLQGSQDTAAAADAVVSLYGNVAPGKPDLKTFLTETEYTRLMWYPQLGFDRVQVWQSKRVAPVPGFEPKPYVELDAVSSLLGSFLYTLIGNLDDVASVPAKLKHWDQHLCDLLEGNVTMDDCPRGTCSPPPAGKMSRQDFLEACAQKISAAAKAHLEVSDAVEPARGQATRELAASLDLAHEGLALSDVWAKILTLLISWAIDGLLHTAEAQKVASWLDDNIDWIMPLVLGVFVTDGTLSFQDTWMCGLPMDNQMDDQLWPIAFTELWIPLEKTSEVMDALHAHYYAGGDSKKAYAATGAFSCEIYGTTKSRFWMSPSYGSDVVRLDIFWFELNAGEPQAFFEQFWKLLKPFGFRPHWGKYFPRGEGWPAYYAAQLPKMQDFLQLREKLDPDQVFVSDYWRTALGIAKPSTGASEHSGG